MLQCCQCNIWLNSRAEPALLLGAITKPHTKGPWTLLHWGPRTGTFQRHLGVGGYLGPRAHPAQPPPPSCDDWRAR